jgi:phage shock protein A
MSAERILELEQQLVTANEAVASITLANAELTKQLADAESRNKKLKRNARSDESSLRSQLAVAQSRRG